MKHQSMIRSVVTGFALTMAVATAQAQPGQATATQASSASPNGVPQNPAAVNSACNLVVICPAKDMANTALHRMSGHGQAGMPGMGQFPSQPD